MSEGRHTIKRALIRLSTPSPMPKRAREKAELAPLPPLAWERVPDRVGEGHRALSVQHVNHPLHRS
jgi:hypothetical protein